MFDINRQPGGCWLTIDIHRETSNINIYFNFQSTTSKANNLAGCVNFNSWKTMFLFTIYAYYDNIQWCFVLGQELTIYFLL